MSLLLLLKGGGEAKPEPTLPVVLSRKPPIELGVEIETAEGAIFRLDADQLKAQNVPSAMSFTTQRGDGFGTASFTLSREIFRDWPDLNLLDTVRFIARDGSIAYEGLIQSFPRTNEPQQQITVQCVGWMTSLKWKPMAALIIDRRLGGWAEPSTQRRANILSESRRLVGAMSAGWQYSEGALGPAIVFDYAGTISSETLHEAGEAQFYAGGQDIGALRYSFRVLQGYDTSNTTQWQDQASISTDDLLSAHEDGTNHGQNNAENQELTEPYGGRKFAVLRSTHLTGASGNQMTASHAWMFPRAIGTHGLTAHGNSPEEGYYVSDIIEYLLTSSGSKLVWEGEENQFPLTQCTWHDNPKTPYDAIQELNNYVLWETNVWEEKKFHFEPADLTQPDWQIRTTDPGVSVQFQGDSIESFASGVVITYSDFFGHTYTLYPIEHAELQDENENNAAARHGEDIWISYTIPWQCLQAEALQFGRAYLAQNNRAKRPGSFTVVGHIQDSAGHWRRASEVRCSQTLSIVDDLYEGEPRLITATSYDEESATLTITVDTPPMTIEAWIARQQNALEARNLTSA